ncbi:MAG: DUF3347 domain-containing protein [Bacteroidota bacterium]|nr:DUF3347 domain-containing protein [Bacteroidota bacterium]
MKLQNLSLLVVLFIFTNCSSQNKSYNSSHQVSTKDSSLSPGITSNDVNAQFKEVLKAYMEMKNALVNEDANTASISGKAVMKAIDAMDMKSMNAKEHAVWMKYMENLSYDAEHIKGTSEIEHQREHFITLSSNLYQVVKVFNAHSENVYYQYCPMANDGKGAYWLSDQSKIRNPYFGKKMLSCGSTKETLPTAKQ